MRVLDLSALPGTCVEQYRDGEGWLKVLRELAGCHVQCVFPRVVAGALVGIASSRMFLAPSKMSDVVEGVFAVAPLTPYTDGSLPGPHPALGPQLQPVPEVFDEVGRYTGELVEASVDGNDLADLTTDGMVKVAGGRVVYVKQVRSPSRIGGLLMMINCGHGERETLEPVKETMVSSLHTYLRVVRAVQTGQELLWDYNAITDKKNEAMKCMCGCGGWLVAYVPPRKRKAEPEQAQRRSLRLNNM
jgi:hypothetical protein